MFGVVAYTASQWKCTFNYKQFQTFVTKALLMKNTIASHIFFFNFRLWFAPFSCGGLWQLPVNNHSKKWQSEVSCSHNTIVKCLHVYQSICFWYFFLYSKNNQFCGALSKIFWVLRVYLYIFYIQKLEYIATVYFNFLNRFYSDGIYLPKAYCFFSFQQNSNICYINIFIYKYNHC